MRKEIDIRLKAPFVKILEEGYPLIAKEALVTIQDLQEEGSILKLTDEKNNFLARAYYGRQNKGLGWILTREENESINQEFFEIKFKQALAYRAEFYADTSTTAFRMFNGEGDGVGGLTIDYYQGYYVISWYSQGIYTFKKMIIDALQKTASPKGIYQKKRFDTNGQYIEDEDFVQGEQAPSPLIVKENDVNFAVYLDDGAMVGVFLDQREVRKRIRDRYAKGKRVLNTFSYTGAFSVFAAKGGAVETTSVDLANRSLPKTREQFEINQIDQSHQRIIVQDVFKYFKYAAKKGMCFDMVILDPPSFARAKKFTFSAAKDYTNLLEEAITITAPGGVIVASTNCSTFDMKKFKAFIKTAFHNQAKPYEILESYSLPKDFKTLSNFKEGDYLKVVCIRVGN